jgi:DnaK suppressor protein
MKTLTQQQVSRLRAVLNEREEALRNEIRSELDQHEDYGELAGEAPDPGDSSFASLSIDLGNAAVMRDMAELRALRAVRTRMENDCYDECINCGNAIPYERLMAQPTAQRCAPCQEMHEKTHIDPTRGSTL